MPRRRPTRDPILHSFQDKELLRIGVRDILGKTRLPETMASLSDLAEVLLTQIVDGEFDALCRRCGGCHAWTIRRRRAASSGSGWASSAAAR